MINNKLILRMLVEQLRLNNITNGTHEEDITYLVKGYNKHNKKVSQKIALVSELNELLESGTWKHWKGSKSTEKYDLDNAHVEIIDIWHFLMSIYIEEIVNAMIANKKEITYNAIVETLGTYVDDLYIKVPKNITLYKCDNNFDFINMVDTFINQTIGMYYLATIYKDKKNLNLIIVKFIETYMSYVSDEESLFINYMSKRVLNAHRQKFGYGVGEYIKNWYCVNTETIVEDNVKAVEFLKEAIAVDGLDDIDKTIHNYTIILENYYKNVVTQYA